MSYPYTEMIEQYVQEILSKDQIAVTKFCPDTWPKGRCKIAIEDNQGGKLTFEVLIEKIEKKTIFGVIQKICYWNAAMIPEIIEDKLPHLKERSVSVDFLESKSEKGILIMH